MKGHKPQSPNWSGVSSNFLRFEIKKRSVKKRKASIKTGRFFEIALKGGDNRNVTWENFDHLVFLSC